MSSSELSENSAMMESGIITKQDCDFKEALPIQNKIECSRKADLIKTHTEQVEKAVYDLKRCFAHLTETHATAELALRAFKKKLLPIIADLSNIREEVFKKADDCGTLKIIENIYKVVETTRQVLGDFEESLNEDFIDSFQMHIGEAESKIDSIRDLMELDNLDVAQASEGMERLQVSQESGTTTIKQNIPIASFQKISKKFYEDILTTGKNFFQELIETLDESDIEGYGLVLLHFMEIESDVLCYQKMHFIEELKDKLEDYERKKIDFQGIKSKKLKTLHENLFGEVSSQITSIFDDIDRILSMDTTTNYEEIETNLITLAYMIFSARNSLSKHPNEKESISLAKIDWIFEFLVSLEASKAAMANNEICSAQYGLQILSEKTEEIRREMRNAEDFFADKEGIILNQQEEKIKMNFLEVQKLSKHFETQICKPIDEFYGDRLDLASQLLDKLSILKLRISVIKVVDSEELIGIFRKFMEIFVELTGIVADVLGMFRGENNISTVTQNCVKWAEISGSILPFLADAFMRIAEQNMEKERLKKVQDFLFRVKELYPPEWWFEFLGAVGGRIQKDMNKYQERIEDFQLTLGNLMHDIAKIFGFEFS